MHFKFRDANRTEVKGWKKMCHANITQKKPGVASTNIRQNKQKAKTLTLPDLRP